MVFSQTRSRIISFRLIEDDNAAGHEYATEYLYKDAIGILDRLPWGRSTVAMVSESRQ